MKFLPIIFFLSLNVAAQTKTDSIQLIRNTAKLYDLDFNEAEADSMLSNLTTTCNFIKDFTRRCQQMISPTLLLLILYRMV